MAYANFQVSLKALISDGTNYLSLRTPNGYLDFPGGRIDSNEYDLPMHDSIVREIIEELGNDFKFDIKEQILVSKRHYNHQDKDHYVLAIFYKVNYLGGDISISDEHKNYNWLSKEQLLDSSNKYTCDNERQELKEYLERANEY